MKKSRFKSLNFRVFLLFFALLGIAVIINSCRKDNANQQQNFTTNLAVSAAKAWYESTYTNVVNTTPLTAAPATAGTMGTVLSAKVNTGSFDFTQRIKPDWNNAATYSRLGKSVVELPIDPSCNKIASSLILGANTVYDKSNSYSSFLLLNDGKSYKAFVMTFIADTSYLKNPGSKVTNNTYRHVDKNFTGVLTYFTPGGQFVSAWFYKNGIVVKSLKANTGAVNATSIKVSTMATNLAVNVNTHINLPGSIGKPKTLVSCTDWYLDTYICDVLVDSEYIGSTCSCNNMASLKPCFDGGAVDPCQDMPPQLQTPIFGINGTNAQVPDENFDDLLAYVESLGMLIGDPISANLLYMGVSYQGEWTVLYDSQGNPLIYYFSPDANSNIFQVGYEYAIGLQDDPGTASSTITGSSGSIGDILGLGNGTCYIGGGTVTYTLPGGGGGGGGIVVNILDEPQGVDAALPSGSGDADDDNNADGNFDNTVYPVYNQSQPWPTITNVLSNVPYVPYYNGSNCLDLAKQQILPNTISNFGAPGQTIQVYTEKGGVNVANVNMAIGYINSQLLSGKPIIVGVDVLPGQAKPPFTDFSTDHFIEIVGSGTDSNGNYYRFYDNSTANAVYGTSPFNKLYYNPSTGLITGNTHTSYDNATVQASSTNLHPYIVTQVRKNKQ